MKRVSILLILILLICGCAKNEITMKINKNKSMIASFNLGIEKSKKEEQKLIQDKLKIYADKIESLKDKNIFIEEYTDADYYGITILKRISNIDDVSNVIDVENNLYNLFSDNSQKQYYFTLDKDFLENNYKLKLYANVNELNSYLNKIEQEFELDNISNVIDFNDIKFTLEIPYESISNNANNVSNNKLNLSWDLNQNRIISAEFKLYNMNHVRAIQFLVIAICLMFISTFFNNKSKKQKVVTVDSNENINKEEKEEIPINNSEYSI